MDFIEENIPSNPVRLIVTAVLLPPILLLPLGKICTAVLAILLLFLVTSNRPYWIYVLSKTCKRDGRIVYYMAKCVFILWWYERNRMTVAKAFNILVEKHPDKIVFHTEEGPWTYKKLSEYSNQAFHMFKEVGVKRGDSVGVILHGGGGARYPGLWLGLSYLGSPVALVPPQLRSTALIHSIKAAKVSAVVYSHHLVDAIQEIRDDPDIKHIKLLQYNMESDTPLLNNTTCIASILKRMPTTTPFDEMSISGYRDVFMYIYTSGTTGLPKAAVITNMRYLMVTLALNTVSSIGSKDIIYTPLPLHHSAGGMLGAGQALIRGTTVVLRAKFSASNYWKDCIKYKCTIGQYIGEICRFLLVSAEKSGEADPAGPHQLRLLVGNGLRPTIWEKFQKTFKIPDIYELYGATEGNTNMINITSKIGAIGFVPRFASLISPIYLVKCDRTTGELIRDENGYCIPCKPCEPGLMLGKLNHKNRLYAFTGYADKESTNKKMLRNIFAPNDCFFNSGDILVMDHFGYYYFMDRTGDTFRWRGENVSTTEVENILTKIIKLADNSVYGVQIPNVEGRAGMAAIVDADNKIDLQNLIVSLKKNLPAYAHPIFIRILPSMPVTTTFKMIKKDLQSDGFDVNKVKDKIYFLEPSTSTYVSLTPKLYDDIVNGKIRL